MLLLNSVSPSLNHRNQKGFTLLETLLYMTLFGLIIGSLVLIGSMIEKNNTQSSLNLSTQEEADFIISKLKWTLDNNILITPNPNSTSSTLTLISPDGLANISVTLMNNQLEIDTSGTKLPITAIRSKVDSFVAQLSADSKLTINFSLNGQKFNFSKLAATSQ